MTAPHRPFAILGRGITLFVILVMNLIAHSMQDVKFDPFPTTTATWSP